MALYLRELFGQASNRAYVFLEYNLNKLYRLLQASNIFVSFFAADHCCMCQFGGRNEDVWDPCLDDSSSKGQIINIKLPRAAKVYFISR